MILVLAVLLIAGGIGAFALLGGGSDSGGDGDGGDGGPEVSNETPEFAFDMRFVTVVPSSSDDAKPDQEAAQPVAENITEAMNAYYRSAFLDPNNWREANYDSAWSAFLDKEAVTGAKEQADVITLGDAYTGAESVMPKPSTDSVKILLSPTGKPAEAVAQVTFGALVTDASGELTTVSNLGQFFLKPVGAKEWKIYAFRIDRQDQPGDQIVGSPSPEPKKDKKSPSPAAEETP